MSGIFLGAISHNVALILLHRLLRVTMGRGEDTVGWGNPTSVTSNRRFKTLQSSKFFCFDFNPDPLLVILEILFSLNPPGFLNFLRVKVLMFA